MYVKIGLSLVALLIISSSTLGALSSSLQRLYVANEDSDSISVIDPAMGSVITRVPTGPHPHNVNVDPSGRYFYVTNYEGNALQVFNIETNILVTTVRVGNHPAHVVPDPTGKTLYVSNEGGSSLTMISVPDFKVTGSMELKGQGPHGHVISRDGRILLTPNSRSGNVSVIDLVQNKTDLIKLPSGAKPVAIGITSDGKFAFVTDAGLNQVHKIDVARKVVLGSLPVGKRPIQVPVHPTRPLLYIPCMEADALYKVDIEKWKVEKVIPVGKGAHGIAYSKDGNYAYVTLTWEKPKGKVVVVDMGKDKTLISIEVEEAPNGVALLFGKNQGS